MGWLKKAFKKVTNTVVRVASGGLVSAARVRKIFNPSASELPEVIDTPAPAQSQQLGDTEGSAEKEKDTKAKARKGKKALKIEATGAGRNIV